VDHSAEGIRAVSLSPGAIMTSRLTGRYGSEQAVSELFAGRHPIGRLGTPQEVAEAALFLASGKATFFTGSDVIMDGGYTAV
jgi:NAD(P)-dependent dehydrogenase (short-subunit alcohol dehydrogenase family)